MRNNFHIWEGIYRNFSETPADAAGYDNPAHLRRSLSLVRRLLRSGGAKASIHPASANRDYLLPILTAQIMAKAGRVKVVDYGGGLGATYLQVRHALPRLQGLDYHIVEVRRICRAGRILFRKDARIHFHEEAPRLKSVDILHFGSSLQYIEDWRGMLRRLLKLRPAYVLLSDLPAGDIPTYATVQNFYGSRISYWFFNLPDVLSRFTAAGFKLVFKSRFTATVLGKVQKLPQRNFPTKYRLGQTCNLLFQAG